MTKEKKPTLGGKKPLKNCLPERIGKVFLIFLDLIKFSCSAVSGDEQKMVEFLWFYFGGFSPII